jgi:hypothetical protein
MPGPKLKIRRKKGVSRGPVENSPVVGNREDIAREVARLRRQAKEEGKWSTEYDRYIDPSDTTTKRKRKAAVTRSKANILERSMLKAPRGRVGK